MTTGALNKMEIFNETMVLFSGYFMFIFSEWTRTAEDLYLFGYVYTYFVLFTLSVNMIIIIFSSLNSCYEKTSWRLKRYNNKEEARKKYELLVEDCKI